MAKNWQNVEQIFQNIGINYELRNWFYLCNVQGRQFYYSPQTGKWRIKGKRVWQFSQSPEEFVAKAKVYSPPETKYGQQNTQRKSSNKKSEKDSKSKRNRYGSNSSNQKRRTGKVIESKIPIKLNVFGTSSFELALDSTFLSNTLSCEKH